MGEEACLVMNFSTFSSHFCLLLLVSAIEITSTKEITKAKDAHLEVAKVRPAESRLSYSKGPIKPVIHANGGPEVWPLIRPEVPQIRNIHVKCEKNHMKVSIEFDRAFYGVIFSKGHYSDAKCLHLAPGSGQNLAKFEIYLGTCGTTSSDQGSHGPGHRPGSGVYIENTVIIQYDSQVQEIWDLARRLRCTWYDYYEKPVSFRPFNVDMMDAVTANFLGDNIQCWMQIQAGKGPWASEVTGIVKIGQTMTMVLAIKDDENKFDMLVRNCVAHDGRHSPIQLIDDFGCVARPKIISPFQKVKNFGASATVVSYAFFQAFKFPDSMDVYFQCTVQVCRYECPEAKCHSSAGLESGAANKMEISVQASSSEAGIIREKSAVPASVVGETATGEEATEEGYQESDSQQEASIKYVTPLSHASVFDSYSSVIKKHGVNEHSSDAMQSRKHNNISIASSSSSPQSSSSPPRGKPMPRQLRRSQRQVRGSSSPASSIQFTDIRTEKVIHVLAPGDVSFYLPLEDNLTSTPSPSSYLPSSGTISYKLDVDESVVCFSRTSFLLSILLLVSLVFISSLSAIFLYYRVARFVRRSLKNIASCSNSAASCGSSLERPHADAVDFPRIPGFGLFHSPP